MKISSVIDDFKVVGDPYYQEFTFYTFEDMHASSVEVEVGELLYSLVRCEKPDWVVELGTNLGISTLFLAQALRDNVKGRLITVDNDGNRVERARHVINKADISTYVEFHVTDSRSLNHVQSIDMIFFDTEHDFDQVNSEINTYYDRVRHNGLLLFHDIMMFGGVKDAVNQMKNRGPFQELIVPIQGRGFGIYRKLG